MKQLLPHQIEDAKFLSQRAFAGNFSGMGSGKTLTALEALKLVGDADRLYHTCIVVGPPISLSMWKEEFEDFFPGCTAQILKTGAGKIDPDADAIIMSYQIATIRRDELKGLGTPMVLICDESHALKSTTAKRTKAIIGRGGLCESAEHTWLLTGTPSTRYSDDLFTFLCRADAAGMKERVGEVDLSRFRLRYCITQKKKFSTHQRFPIDVVVGNRNLKELNEWMFEGRIAVRRELVDVFKDMPPLTINHLQVRLLDTDPELRQMLKAMEKQTMSQIEEDIGRKEEHISTLRRKIGAAKVKHSVSEIVDRVEAGIKPILVGAIHHDTIDALHDALLAKGISNVAVIDGRTNSKTRDIYIDSFQNGTLDILIGQIQAMGVAITLTGGSHIICVETTFSPAEQDQFYARCHRIGQKDHVHVDVFEADCKLEKAVRRILATKARGHAALMDQGDAAA
jgi:SNF2 family DNA or RNA helicase